MNISEIFFQSSLVNIIIFCWIVCGIYNVQILLRCHCKIYIAVLSSLFFAPLAFLLSFSYESLVKKNMHKTKIPVLWPIVLVSFVFMSIFYVLFVKINLIKNYTEQLPLILAIFNMLLGIIFGVFLAIWLKKVSFFESTIVVFIISLGNLFLKDWAEQVFSYGTSSAYFVVLIVSLSFLLLLFLSLGGALGYLFFGESRFNPKISYEFFIGLRFLMSKKSSEVVSLISIISVVAVMISCAGMIVVMSVMNGFSDSLRSKILGANAHLMVLKYGNDFSEYNKIIDQTKNIDGLLSAMPFILKEGLVSSDKNVSGAMIIGIDVDALSESSHLLQYVSKESLANIKDPTKIKLLRKSSDDKEIYSGVIVGKEMALDLGLLVGDLINFISPAGDIGPTGIIPRAKTFRVAGMFKSDMYEYDSKFAYMSIKDAQDFFNFKENVSGVEYRLKDLKQTRAIAKEIDEKIGGYPFYVRDWIQMNKNIFSALQLEKIAMLIILATLIFMASLLILVTLIMVVIEKGKDIAILKSMGATDPSIMKIFVTYGLSVGTMGAFLGGLLGILLCKLVEKIGITIDADIYYFSSIPVLLDYWEVALVIFAAIIISFLATIPPSLFAARLKPVEGLRYD